MQISNSAEPAPDPSLYAEQKPESGGTLGVDSPLSCCTVWDGGEFFGAWVLGDDLRFRDEARNVPTYGDLVLKLSISSRN